VGLTVGEVFFFVGWRHEGEGAVVDLGGWEDGLGSEGLWLWVLFWRT